MDVWVKVAGCPETDSRKTKMSANTKPVRAIAHTITTYGFGEVHRRISADSRKTAEEKIWSHIGALAAQVATHVTIEALGNYFDSRE
jgi:hypothetical protein